MCALVIRSVKGAPAGRSVCGAGDRILRLDGQAVEDELDFHFLLPPDRVRLEILRSGETLPRILRLSEEEARRLFFEPMRPKRCRNRCVFCFVDQLPPGMRRTLYVKDEDYRLSFLYGNYVTLSALSDAELERIVRMRLSPLYVSVHATDPEVRNLLLGRRSSRDILETLRALARGGVVVHTQIVLCPGINDGEVLKRTVEDLAALHPAVASIAVVPVGRTRFRKKPERVRIEAFSSRYCKKIIREIEILQGRLKQQYHTMFLYLADEFYLKAERPFPAYRHYNDFPQWENGVGMLPLFFRAWKKGRRRAAWPPGRHSRLVAVTGELAYPHLRAYVEALRTLRGIPVELVPVANRFFGRQVTVAGLVTGRDIVKNLRGILTAGSVLLVPEVMLNHDNRKFLDDLSLQDVGAALGVPVFCFRPDPTAFEKTLEKCRRNPAEKSDPLVD